MLSYDEYLSSVGPSIASALDNANEEAASRRSARSETFYRNVNRIWEFNNKEHNASYRLGINHLVDWLPHELDLLFSSMPP